MTTSSYLPTEEQIAQLPAPRPIPGPGPFNGGLWRAVNVMGFVLIEYLTGSRLVSIDEGGADVLESAEPVILAGNHNHRFDGTAILMGLLQARRSDFTVVSSSLMFRVWGLWPDRLLRIRGWFILGLLAHAYGAVWVHDGEERGATTIIRLSRLLEARESLMIFPSGRLAYGDEEAEYQIGTVLIAQRAGVPIVPARVDGVLEVLRRFGHLRPDAAMVVRYGTPVTVGPADDPAEALARLRAALAPPAEPMVWSARSVWRTWRGVRINRRRRAG